MFRNYLNSNYQVKEVFAMKKLKLFILAVGAAAMMLACSRQKEDKTVNEETTVEETTDFLNSIVKVTAIPYGKKEITDKCPCSILILRLCRYAEPVSKSYYRT